MTALVWFVILVVVATVTKNRVAAVKKSSPKGKPMAKKPKYIQPELGGVDWSSAVHDPDMQHDRWRDVPVGDRDPDQASLNLNTKQFPGYHSTNAPRAAIAKGGLKVSDPSAENGGGYGQGVIGVYYHHYPQAEYGKDVYRLAIDHTRKHVSDPPEGDALARDISAKNVTRIGHRGEHEWGKRYDESDVHYETDMANPAKECPLCVSAAKHTDAKWSKRNEATNE